jgi:hypothetical protein
LLYHAKIASYNLYNYKSISRHYTQKSLKTWDRADSTSKLKNLSNFNLFTDLNISPDVYYKLA